MLTDEQITRSLQSAGCAGVVRMSFESGPYCIDRPTIKASRFAEQIESAATAPLLARIAELEQQLEEARKDAERYRWLCGFSSVSMPELTWGRRAGIPKNKLDAAIDAAIKDQT